jgi:hypothetical protein
MRVSPWSFVATAAAAATLTLASASFGQSCGDPGAGDCCVANGTPFCNDADCCNAVCADDPFCCDTEWDAICAGAAAAVCAVCDVDCPIDCSGATSEEGEPCGDDTNGGCNNPDELVSFADVGDVICGTYWADEDFRDTDWYEFSIAENKILSFSVTGSIPTNLFLVSASCPPAVIEVAVGVVGSCDPVVIGDTCLPAGSYRVVVVPQNFNGSPCADEEKYVLSIIDSGQICTGPKNDSCPGATQIAEGDTPFDTTDAFTNGDALPAECTSFGSVTIFNDIWFKITPSETTLYKISTCNQADFDTRLAVYSGDCDNLAIVGCNDDGAGCGLTSDLLAELVAGTEYFIRVGGFGVGGGAGILTVAAFEPCDNSCPDGSYVEAEPCGGDSNGGCNGGGAYEDISVPGTICGTFYFDGALRDTDWFRFNLPQGNVVTLEVRANYPVVLALLSATCDPIIYVIEAQNGCPSSITACLPAGENVAFVAPQFGSVLGCDSDLLSTYTATISLGEPCTPPSCGNSPNDCCLPGDGSPFCSDAACCEAVCSFDAFCCNVAWDAVCADEANQTCKVCGVVPPQNDDCGTALPITNGLTEFSTNGASTSPPPLDPICDEGFGLSFVNDIWYSYVANCDGITTFSTCGFVDFDTRLAVYSGSCDNLAIVGCNDDGLGCPGLSSRLEVELTAGQTYFLRIGGFAGSGSGTIDISCGGGTGIPNDDCAGATPIVNGANPFSTVGATGETLLPGQCTSFGQSDINNDVWFTYVAGGDGPVTIGTCGTANFDTFIAVFSGSCSNLALVACNDDFAGCAGFTSQVTFTPTCGTTYYVVVGAYGEGISGSGTLTVAQTGSCPVNCPADLNGDGSVGSADLTILLAAWGTPGPGDLNGDGSVGSADLTILLAAWGPCSAG